jgi:hypothetical protein
MTSLFTLIGNAYEKDSSQEIGDEPLASSRGICEGVL